MKIGEVTRLQITNALPYIVFNNYIRYSDMFCIAPLKV